MRQHDGGFLSQNGANRDHASNPAVISITSLALTYSLSHQ